ncbi:MAG: Tab2/Atab2 family RNA-binding protein [Cyanobacteriota bacterium]|nr:Tab2/Atab2 family RNA-binding protein [Cyanobacteriota bacterium]
MIDWQADLHRPPLVDSDGQPLWELLLCNRDASFTYVAQVPQAGVNQAWLTAQLRRAKIEAGGQPDRLRVFRPQALSLLRAGAAPLGIEVQATRHTPTLHRWLKQRAHEYVAPAQGTGLPYQPLELDRSPPLPLPESLWGRRWGFTALTAAEFERTLPYEPIPIRGLPEDWLPSRLGLASSAALPGVVIEAGPQALPLCRWIETAEPAWLRYQAGDLGGLILEAGLSDRWVVATFSDPQVGAAGQRFEEGKGLTQGLHFLLVQPDDSGMTYTGLWLLREGSC